MADDQLQEFGSNDQEIMRNLLVQGQDAQSSGIGALIDRFSGAAGRRQEAMNSVVQRQQEMAQAQQTLGMEMLQKQTEAQGAMSAYQEYEQRKLAKLPMDDALFTRMSAYRSPDGKTVTFNDAYQGSLNPENFPYSPDLWRLAELPVPQNPVLAERFRAQIDAGIAKQQKYIEAIDSQRAGLQSMDVKALQAGFEAIGDVANIGAILASGDMVKQLQASGQLESFQRVFNGTLMFLDKFMDPQGDVGKLFQRMIGAGKGNSTKGMTRFQDLEPGSPEYTRTLEAGVSALMDAAQQKQVVDAQNTPGSVGEDRETVAPPPVATPAPTQRTPTAKPAPKKAAPAPKKTQTPPPKSVKYDDAKTSLDKVLVRWKGKTLRINRKDLAQALKDGAVEVKE